MMTPVLYLDCTLLHRTGTKKRRHLSSSFVTLYARVHVYIVKRKIHVYLHNILKKMRKEEEEEEVKEAKQQAV